MRRPSGSRAAVEATADSKTIVSDPPNSQPHQLEAFEGRCSERARIRQESLIAEVTQRHGFLERELAPQASQHDQATTPQGFPR